MAELWPKNYGSIFASLTFHGQNCNGQYTGHCGTFVPPLNKSDHFRRQTHRWIIITMCWAQKIYLLYGSHQGG